MKTVLPLFTLAAVVCIAHGDRTTVQGQETSPAAQSPGKRQEITKAEFSPDGRRVVVTSSNGKVRIWNAQAVQGLPVPTNGTVQIWDAASGKPLSPRYQDDTPDHMPIVGPDHFKQLQDQIDALEKRVQALEKKLNASGR